jgi:ABC-type sugar transport system substrate-binding protein
VRVPKESVGVIEVLGSSEAITRTLNATKAGAKVLGWSVKVCDAQGQPAMAASCANTLIAEHVTLILGEAIEPAWVQAQLTLAKSKGIPWINDSGPVTPNPLIDEQSTYDETTMGETMGKYIVATLHGAGDVATTEISAQYAIRVRSAGILAALHTAPGIHVVQTHDVALADPSADGHQWALSVLTQYPKLAAIAMSTDADSPGEVPAVQQRFPGAQYPHRPLLVGAFGDLFSLAYIRKGQMDAVADTPIESTAWISLDRAAAFFARKVPLPREGPTGYPLNLIPVTTVTKANVPTAGDYFPSPVDYVTFFTTKWRAEYKDLP